MLVALRRMTTKPERMYTLLSSSSSSCTPAALVMVQFLPMLAFLSTMAVEQMCLSPKRLSANKETKT